VRQLQDILKEKNRLIEGLQHPEQDNLEEFLEGKFDSTLFDSYISN